MEGSIVANVKKWLREEGRKSVLSDCISIISKVSTESPSDPAHVVTYHYTLCVTEVC